MLSCKIRILLPNRSRSACGEWAAWARAQTTCGGGGGVCGVDLCDRPARRLVRGIRQRGVTSAGGCVLRGRWDETSYRL